MRWALCASPGHKKRTRIRQKKETTILKDVGSFFCLTPSPYVSWAYHENIDRLIFWDCELVKLMTVVIVSPVVDSHSDIHHLNTKIY